MVAREDDMEQSQGTKSRFRARPWKVGVVMSWWEDELPTSV
jgi:hypothetical protein